MTDRRLVALSLNLLLLRLSMSYVNKFRSDFGTEILNVYHDDFSAGKLFGLDPDLVESVGEFVLDLFMRLMLLL